MGWVGLFKKHRRHECLIGVLLPGDRIEAAIEDGHCEARALTPVFVRIAQDLRTDGRELGHVFRQCVRSRLSAADRTLDLFIEIYQRLHRVELASDWSFEIPLNKADISKL